MEEVLMWITSQQWLSIQGIVQKFYQAFIPPLNFQKMKARRSYDNRLHQKTTKAMSVWTTLNVHNRFWELLGQQCHWAGSIVLSVCVSSGLCEHKGKMCRLRQSEETLCTRNSHSSCDLDACGSSQWQTLQMSSERMNLETKLDDHAVQKFISSSMNCNCGLCRWRCFHFDVGQTKRWPHQSSLGMSESMLCSKGCWFCETFAICCLVWMLALSSWPEIECSSLVGDVPASWDVTLNFGWMAIPIFWPGFSKSSSRTKLKTQKLRDLRVGKRIMGWQRCVLFSHIVTLPGGGWGFSCPRTPRAWQSRLDWACVQPSLLESDQKLEATAINTGMLNLRAWHCLQCSLWHCGCMWLVQLRSDPRADCQESITATLDFLSPVPATAWLVATNNLWQLRWLLQCSSPFFSILWRHCSCQHF